MPSGLTGPPPNQRGKTPPLSPVECRWWAEQRIKFLQENKIKKQNKTKKETCKRAKQHNETPDTHPPHADPAASCSAPARALGGLRVGAVVLTFVFVFSPIAVFVVFRAARSVWPASPQRGRSWEI